MVFMDWLDLLKYHFLRIICLFREKYPKDVKNAINLWFQD